MPLSQYPLALNNSDQDTDIIGDPSGFNIVRLAFDQAPSAGTVVIKYRQPWTNTFTTLAHANGQSITSGFLQVRIDDPVAVIRVTFTGLVGGVAPRLWVEQRELPDGLFAGNAGMIMQPYTEMNVKRGVQFFARAAWPNASPIGAGATVKMHLVTGSKPILLKLRELTFTAEELVLRLYANPTGVAAGTDLTIKNYNQVNPVATTVTTAKKNVTTVSDGTELEPNDPEYFYGANAASGRVQSQSPIGLERVIGPNSSLLVTLTNTTAQAARAQYFLTWYEGEPDLPL